MMVVAVLQPFLISNNDTTKTNCKSVLAIVTWYYDFSFRIEKNVLWPLDFGKQIYECAMEEKTNDIPVHVTLFQRIMHVQVCT